MTREGRCGAYGLRLPGTESAAHLLPSVAADLPVLRIRQVLVSEATESLGREADYVAPLLGGGELRMARDTGVATYVVPGLVGAEELIHPLLAPAAAQANFWAGRTVLHGGVVAHSGAAVAVVGDREAGKSTLLALLARDGRFDVLSDDLTVIDGDLVHAGPRCIDLRRPAAERLRVPERLVRGRSRQRLQLPPCAATARFGGVVVLAWADELTVSRLSADQRLPALHPHATVQLSAAPLRRLLAVAARPVWVVSRAPDWSGFDQTIEVIANLLAEVAA